MRGKFITLEGGDGVGKSTQVKSIVTFLKDRGIEAVQTREVGGSSSAEVIRDLWLKEKEGHWDSLTEVLLISAARREHIVKTIAPALDRGAWVISDRFVDSTRAYQGIGLGLGLELIDSVSEIVAPNFIPDLTFLLDLSVEDAFSRMTQRGGQDDRYQQKNLEFHQKLRDAYLMLAEKYADRFRVINASVPQAIVGAQIQQRIVERFSL